MIVRTDVPDAVPASRVLPARESDLAACDAFVLAGGLGTRIRPVLGDVPKLLAPVGDRPFLSLMIDWLRRFGVRRLVLGLGHRAEAVGDWLRRHPPADLAVEIVVEPRPLGTAGALRFARARLRSDPVLVMNGDSFVDADLGAFLAAHRASGARASLLCAEVDDAGRYGRVAARDGRIDRFVEKDEGFHGRALINAGVYCLSAALLDEIAAGVAVSLERDVFERLPAGTLAGHAGRFPFIDIGTPESLARAAAAVAAMRLAPASGASA
jgi:NDP-sugar pyrophosphorylase family protein